MTYANIAIIGAGNMGASLLAGLIASGHPLDRLIASNQNPSKLRLIQEQYKIAVTSDNKKAAQDADVVILAVKPKQFKQAAAELSDIIQAQKPLVISIAAGIRTSQINDWLKGSIAIVRSMPNLPALIGEGITALFANAYVSNEQKQKAEQILKSVGLTIWIKEESLMDAVTAISGSGPAYFFMIFKALREAGCALGLDSKTALLLSLQTGLGAAKMVLTSDETLEDLLQKVVSPGGTTEKALSVLKRYHVPGALKEAVFDAKQHAETLSDLADFRK